MINIAIHEVLSITWRRRDDAKEDDSRTLEIQLGDGTIQSITLWPARPLPSPDRGAEDAV